MTCFVRPFSPSLAPCACKELNFFSLNKKQLAKMATSTRSVTNKTKMLEAWYNTVHICWEETLGRGDLNWSLMYAENIIPGSVEADPFTYWLLPGHWMKVFKLQFGVQLLLQPLDQGLWPSLIGRVVSHCRSFSLFFFFFFFSTCNNIKRQGW